MLLDCSVHFLNVMVSIPRAVKVPAHQLDAMMVDHDRCCGGPFVDVLSVIDSFCASSCSVGFQTLFVLVSSCSHEDVILMRLPNF